MPSSLYQGGVGKVNIFLKLIYDVCCAITIVQNVIRANVVGDKVIVANVIEPYDSGGMKTNDEMRRNK